MARQHHCFSSLDWYFQRNLCQGLTVDLLYEGIKLSHWWFLCACIPGKSSCFGRETHCLKMFMTEIFWTFWMNLVLDSIPLSTLAPFFFCYFILLENENIRFHHCFSSHPSESQVLPCTFTAWNIAYTPCSLSLNFFQNYFLLNNNRWDSSCPVEIPLFGDWKLPVPVNRTRNWSFTSS